MNAQRLGAISAYLAGFRPVGLALIIFSFLNLTIFTLILLWPELLQILWLSSDRPWGIVTSLFVHKDPEHLVNNLRGFTIWGALFVALNLLGSVRARMRWSRVFLWTVFLSGIAVNTLQFLAFMVTGESVNSWGASGVVYSSMGVLLASALCNLLPSLAVFSAAADRWRKTMRYREKVRAGFNLLKVSLILGICVGVVISFFSLLIQDPRTFFGAGPEIDVFAHQMGFLFGFFVAMPLGYKAILKS